MPQPVPLLVPQPAPSQVEAALACFGADGSVGTSCFGLFLLQGAAPPFRFRQRSVLRSVRRSVWRSVWRSVRRSVRLLRAGSACASG